jgi:hypothetical protein
VYRSEIPQLEVVTAIPDAESEDFLSQLLFSQGWSIIYRAFDCSSLLEFMKSRGIELRTVIIYQSDFPHFDERIIEEFNSPTVTFISLDKIPFSSHEIMSTIRGKLRAPMLHQDSATPVSESHEQTIDGGENFAGYGDAPSVRPNFQRFPSPEKTHKQEREGAHRNSKSGAIIQRANRRSSTRGIERKLIAVTGSSGAPGRTRFATLLAKELSQVNPVLLIDADIRSYGLSGQRKALQENQIEILPLDKEARPTQIPEGEETTIVDLGTLPGLAEAVTDRRWYGSLINNILEGSTHLIYLSKSTPSSMAELSQFLREYPLLLKRLPVTYLCILTGHSRELREWESKFLSLTTGENRFILRESQLEIDAQNSLFGAIRFGNSGRKEIAKIALSLR